MLKSINSIWEDLKGEYRRGNMVTRIILVNVVVFVLMNFVWLIMRFASGSPNPPAFEALERFFSMPADPLYLITHPWTPLTSMFLHVSFWHILWNMLYLYWFGRILHDFLGNQRILPIYILSGLGGVFLYFLFANLPFEVTLLQLNPNGFAMGASAAVLGIAVASATLRPDYEMFLLFVGRVKLKYIVGALVLLNLFVLGLDPNTGGIIAHLGGAFVGFLTIRQLQAGTDWTAPLNKILNQVGDFLRKFAEGPKSSKGPRVVYRNPKKPFQGKKGKKKSDNGDLDHQQKLDSILDKIKKSGYDSLSKDEKEFLFKASKK